MFLSSGFFDKCISFWYLKHASNVLLKKNQKQPSKVFFGKCVLKICSKFTGEHPCRSAISKKLPSNFVEIAFWYGCSPVNLLHIFRTPFYKNTSEWLLLKQLMDFTEYGYKTINQFLTVNVFLYITFLYIIWYCKFLETVKLLNFIYLSAVNSNSLEA